MAAPTSFTQQYLVAGARCWALELSNNRQGCCKYLTYAGRAAYVSIVPLVGTLGALYHSIQAVKNMVIYVFSRDPIKSNEAECKVIHHRYAIYYDTTSVFKLLRDELIGSTIALSGALTVLFTAATVASLAIEPSGFFKGVMLTTLSGFNFLVLRLLAMRICSNSLAVKFIKNPSQIQEEFSDGSDEIKLRETKALLVKGLVDFFEKTSPGI